MFYSSCIVELQFLHCRTTCCNWSSIMPAKLHVSKPQKIHMWLYRFHMWSYKNFTCDHVWFWNMSRGIFCKRCFSYHLKVLVRVVFFLLIQVDRPPLSKMSDMMCYVKENRGLFQTFLIIGLLNNFSACTVFRCGEMCEFRSLVLVIRKWSVKFTSRSENPPMLMSKTFKCAVPLNFRQIIPHKPQIIAFL